MEKEIPNYYAVIPANVRYDEKLTPNAKLLYGEIVALSNKDGCCWAKNKYFMDLYKVGKSAITNWLNQLKENRYIEIELIYKEGSKEISHRYIKIMDYPIPKKCDTPIPEMWQDNNINISNNTSISITSNNKEYILCEEEIVINYLNEKTNSHFKPTKNNYKLVKDLLKPKKLITGEEYKYTIDDIKYVIDNKVKQWANTDYAKYLRPSTLFRESNFEKYIEEKPTESKGQDMYDEIIKELEGQNNGN